LVQARIAALKALVDQVPADASQRTDYVAGTLSRLARSIEVVLSATSMAALVPPPSSAEPSALDALQETIARLGRSTFGARQRCGEDVDEVPPPSGFVSVPLAVAVERAVEDQPSSRAELARAVQATVDTAGAGIPLAIADLVSLVLERLLDLPLTRPSHPVTRVVPPAEIALPPWLPSRRTLGGFYVLRALGGGAAGSVFMVTRAEERHDPGADRFALKVPDYDATAARSLSEAEFLRLFRQEAGALLAVPEHPNLARFVTFDAGARPKPILVMELVEGARLDQLLAARSLTTHAALSLLDHVLAGLVAMHSVGVGHLDLKPSNVVLRGGKEAVLVDFGLAGRHLRPGCGTVCYGSPEVWGVVPEGVAGTPMTADVYSFGCLAFEVLTGETLFDGPSEVAVVSAHLLHDGLPTPLGRFVHVPRFERLVSFLHACLRHSPRDRAPAAALRAELATLAPTLSPLPWPLMPEAAPIPRDVLRLA
jgi:serine/threonine protein kinase